MGTYIALSCAMIAAVASIAATTYRRIRGHLDDHSDLVYREITRLITHDRGLRERLAAVGRSEAKSYLQQRAEARGEVYVP